MLLLLSLVFGLWLLVFGCWSLVVGLWLLVFGMSTADAMYRVPTAYWLQMILKPSTINPQP